MLLAMIIIVSALAILVLMFILGRGERERPEVELPESIFDSGVEQHDKSSQPPSQEAHENEEVSTR